MRKRRLSKALAMFLAAALTIPAAVPVAASESTADKEETVYVKTDANGEEKTVIVSDWLKNFSGEAKIKDATDLTDVENVKGNETYKRGKKDSITCTPVKWSLMKEKKPPGCIKVIAPLSARTSVYK